MTDTELQAIRDRCEKATPGPWRTTGMRSYIIPPHGYSYKVAQLGGSLEQPGLIARNDEYLAHDADFIAHSRIDVETLLAEVERLKKGTNP